MGANTAIEWCHHTFNPWWGCTRVSPACEHCYAETFSKRVGLKVWGPTAERRFFGLKHWNEPHRWNAAAKRAGERRRVFCASMADVCEDHDDPRIQSMLNGARRELARLIEETPRLDWLLLTKRIEHFREVFPVELFTGHEYPRNIWPGTTTENQKWFDARAPHLVALRALFPVVFISYEPGLGPLDLSGFIPKPPGWKWAGGIECRHGYDACPSCDANPERGISWVIVGGESGGGARPFDMEWARSIIEQCHAARVPCFVKQLGAKPHLSEDGWILPLKFGAKGADWAEWPEYFRVRQFPEVRA